MVLCARRAGRPVAGQQCLEVLSSPVPLCGCSSPPPGDGATCSEQSRAAWRPGSHVGAKEGGAVGAVLSCGLGSPSCVIDLQCGVTAVLGWQRVSAGPSRGCAGSALSAAVSVRAALVPQLGLRVRNCAPGGCAELWGCPWGCVCVLWG